MKPLIFIGQRAFDAVSFAVNAPVRWALCCDNSVSTTLVRKDFDMELFSLEASTRIRERWSSAHLDRLMEAMWKQVPAAADAASVISYSPSRLLENLVSQKRIIANSNRQKTFFDNKTISRKIFKRLGLTNPRMRSIAFSQAEVETVLGSIDYPSIARKVFSSTGSGTFPVASRDEAYNQLLQQGFTKGETLLLEERIDGIPLNINAVVLEDSVHVYAPSIQLIGIAECTSLPFGFCGNDYISAQSLPTDILKECHAQTMLIGRFLQRLGYRGLFGTDMIIDKQSKVVPCEINPRFQNSTALLNWSHKGSNSSPASLHLAAFGHQAADAKLAAPETNYAQIIVHAKGDETQIVTGGLKEGRYHMQDATLIEETLNLSSLQSGEFFVCSSPPVVGTTIKPEAALFRIIVREKITQDGFTLIHEDIRTAIAKLKSQLHIIPSPINL